MYRWRLSYALSHSIIKLPFNRLSSLDAATSGELLFILGEKRARIW